MKRRALLAGILLLLALAAGPWAFGHEVPRSLPGALAARDGKLFVALDLSSAFPPDLRRQLSNGLTNVIVLHVGLATERGSATAALYGRELDVLFDVWDETWGVTVKDSAEPRGRVRTFASWAELLEFVSEAGGIDLGPLSRLGAQRWVIQTRVELNPVSKELLERTRELLANPGAPGRGGAPSRSVLGAMASYLLEGSDPGADVHLFRSSPFTARDVPGAGEAREREVGR